MTDRQQVINFRVRAQQLDGTGGTPAGTALLDLGVQDTGPDGGRWALAARGWEVSAASGDDLILLWALPAMSPPVLAPIAGFTGPAADRGLDPIRADLRLLGPATPKQVAAYLDAPQKDVKARWPDDLTEVPVDGETR